jgi:hypothetical protein
MRIIAPVIMYQNHATIFSHILPFTVRIMISYTIVITLSLTSFFTDCIYEFYLVLRIN